MQVLNTVINNGGLFIGLAIYAVCSGIVAGLIINRMKRS